jgi:hypothetical protein
MLNHAQSLVIARRGYPFIEPRLAVLFLTVSTLVPAFPFVEQKSSREVTKT